MSVPVFQPERPPVSLLYNSPAQENRSAPFARPLVHGREKRRESCPVPDPAEYNKHENNNNNNINEDEESWVRERAVARRGTKGPVLMQAAALLLSRLLFITAAVGAQAATLCLPRRSQPESRYSRPDIILLYLRSERRG